MTKKLSYLSKLGAIVAILFSLAGSATATIFTSTFDAPASSADFNVVKIAGSNDTITFGYDYSSSSIPEAPSTPMGAASTRGLYIQANKPAPGAINGINVIPAIGGVAISFNHVGQKMSFDMWMNVPSPLTNTTEQALFGINTDGLGVNSRTGNAQTGADGVWYHVANEGGYGNTSTTANSRDVVGYINNTIPAGARLDNGEAPFPALFPNGPLIGAPGNTWVKVVVEEVGSNVVMSMNGTAIFNFANTGPTSGSVFLGYQDPFSTSIGASPLFVIFDNLSVVPEPAAFLFGSVASAIVGMIAYRRRKTA
jgi:azurin